MHQTREKGLQDILESSFIWQAAPDNSIDSELDETNSVNDSGFGTQTREVCKLNDISNGGKLGIKVSKGRKSTKIQNLAKS